MNEEISLEINDAREILENAFAFYKKYFLSFTVFGLCFVLATELGEFGLSKLKVTSMGALFIVNILLTSAVSIACVVFSAKIYLNEKPSLIQSFAATQQKYLIFVSVSLLSAALILAGFFVLILPGIFLTVVLAFADILVVLEDVQSLEALRKSAHLVRGVFRRTFICLIVIVIFLVSPVLIVQQLAQYKPQLAKALGMIITLLLTPYANVAKVGLYYRIKTLKTDENDQEFGE